MSLLSWLNPIDKALDLIGKAVPDKDLRVQLDAELRQLKEQVYLAELSTKTIPWIDGVHKLGRQILSLLNLVVPAVLLWHNPDINPAALAVIASPSAIYNYIKGGGK